MTDRNTIIGDRVRYYRTAHDLTLGQLAARLSKPITAQQMALYETGQSRWPADLVCEVSAVLNVDCWLLLGVEKTRRMKKDCPGWRAEHYKSVLLALKPRIREMVYKIIDGIQELGL